MVTARLTLISFLTLFSVQVFGQNDCKEYHTVEKRERITGERFSWYTSSPYSRCNLFCGRKSELFDKVHITFTNPFPEPVHKVEMEFSSESEDLSQSFRGSIPEVVAPYRERTARWNLTLDYYAEFQEEFQDAVRGSLYGFYKVRECKTRMTSGEMREKRKRQQTARKKEAERQTIYDNCIIDKTPSGASYSVQSAVARTCKKISNDPSFFEKVRYGS